MTDYIGTNLTVRQLSFWEEKQYELQCQIEFYEDLNKGYFKLAILIFSLGVGTFIISQRIMKLKEDLCSVNNKINKIEAQLNFLETAHSVESKCITINGQNKEISRNTKISTNNFNVTDTSSSPSLLSTGDLYSDSFYTSPSGSESSSSDSSSSSSSSSSCCD